MNDLTKEDLAMIIFWGIDRCEAVGKDCFISEGSDKVYDKVIELHNSYCEHDYILNQHDQVRHQLQEIIARIKTEWD